MIPRQMDGMPSSWNESRPARGPHSVQMDTSDTNARASGTDLPSWREGPARAANVDLVRKSCGEDGVVPIPVEARVAVFDNDGTLWCEKPMPIQLDFILRRLVAMATAQPELRERQPWKAAFERDYAWFGKVMADHYAGDDTNVKTLAGGILAAYAGISRGVRDAVRRVPPLGPAPHARRRISRNRVRADGRPARLPRGERVRELHRLRRRPRLHAAD